ncbi:hypothetical protein V502_03607 [Pseudogymnoascus sp. VKM F-4520 (FW-2644)]|nr:hypothetical protein V502_03607 [Pseudogymnoascus sp. VKM F-4520 (FW-2644)]
MPPQLSSTLVEAAQPAARLSWTIMPQPRWENPQLSVGAPHASLDLLGRYKCWSLKDESPAHIVWKTVSKAIINLLEDQYEHLEAEGSELMVEMFMIGRKPTSSIPTILFSCESKACRQKAPVLVRKKGILTDHPRVLMAECSKLPRPLALDEQTDAPCLSPGIYLNGPLRSFGTSILIYSDEGRLPRKATIGGIITIDHELFGVTAAHAFFPSKDEDESETEDLEFAFFGDEDPYDSGDDEDLVELTSQASMSSGSSQSPGTDESEYNFQGSTSANSDSTLNERVMPPRDKAVINMDGEKTAVKLGELFVSTEAGDRLDWALVKIRSSLFTPEFTHLHEFSNVIWGEKLMYPRSIGNATSDVQVLIFTGSEGVVEGSLSGVTSFSLNSNAHKFQSLLTVRRLVGKFSDGDCGSWVFNKETGDVYGHVVSGYPSTGTAYIVPSVQIFENIQHQINKPIELFAHTANELRGNVSKNSDSTIRSTNIPDFNTPQPQRGLSNTYEHADRDRIPSEPLDPNQLSETEHPAPQTSTKASSISKHIDLQLSGRIREIPGCNTCRFRRVRCDGEKPSCMRCIEAGRECLYEIRKGASVNSTELGYSFAKEAQDDDGYASTPEGFTKDLSQVQEMQRTGSDDSKASPSWGNPMPHIRMRARKASSVVSFPGKELPSLFIKSKDGSDAEVGTAIRKPLYRQPKHELLFCPFCKERFRGANELNRHYDRQHRGLVTNWVCMVPEDGIKEQFKPVNDLSHCEACRLGKTYGAYFNAAIHLRRAHFRPNLLDRIQSSKMKDESETRNVKGGADWPPIVELEPWIKEVYVHADDAESSGKGIHASYDEDVSGLVSSDAIAFDSNLPAPNDMWLSDYKSFAASHSDTEYHPSDTSMFMGMELPRQRSTFDSSSSIPFASQQASDVFDAGWFMDDDMAYTDGL